MIEESLRRHLLDELGELVGNRIYPLRMPQKAKLPAIVYRRVSTAPVHQQGGAGTLARHRFQIDCWSHSYAEVLELADRVRQALEGRRSIGASFLDNVQDDYDEEAMLYRRSVDVMVWEEGL